MGRDPSDTPKLAEPLHYHDAPEHPRVAELVDYWNAKRGTRPMPDRADIVPGEIPRLLPNIVICEVLRGGEDFRMRIFGTKLVELTGEERTGKSLSDFGAHAIVPTRPEIVQDRWLEVIRRSYQQVKPVFVSGAMTSSDRPYLAWHAVSCPLTAGGTAVSQLMGGLFVVDRR
ncbi:MAG TPA: PAS domain-containing protein [Parvibaculum sp.]|uniref:PAS domain-containing protein n=1 Tax=Parvibaculum sp. TaxID=2024848 RepID=UPI002CD5886B|nr:PAS domain-containing protein [Parvibaculum sp.]HMM13687.1 PAS domain-containing protein [Parvibaculum sp.]